MLSWGAEALAEVSRSHKGAGFSPVATAVAFRLSLEPGALGSSEGIATSLGDGSLLILHWRFN